MQPKISIIVPVYNVESVLERCLDSLIGQTLHQIEIICVDDGSTDRSPEILARYAEREPRMRCMRQTNQRQGAARNRGFEVATGEYVLYIDSDDWIDPAYCETLYEAARRHDADIACCSFLKHRRQGTRRVAWYEEERCYEQLVERFAVTNCPPDFYIMNKFFRRSLLANLEIRFPERVQYEDVEFLMRALGEMPRLVTVPGICYHLVSRQGSTTKSRQTPQQQEQRYRALTAFVAYADRVGLPLRGRDRTVTKRYYEWAGICLLKQKVRDGRATWRLFDLLPIWCSKI